MNNMYFTEEHELFRNSLKEFLKKEVVPHVDEWESQGKIHSSIWKKFGEMGYLGISYPEQYGGLDLDIFYMIIFLEELQKVNSGGFAAAVWAHVYLAMTHLKCEANESIKSDYLEKSISGDKIGCLCITEPFGGSDVAGMRTTAIIDGDHFIVNGSKTFITNGVYSDYLIVAAKTNPEQGNKGISIFLLDRDMEGITATKLDKLGWRASDTAELAFDNVKVPKENLLGELNKGFSYIMQHFASERLIMAVNAHARAEYALDYAVNYMSERLAFGKTIDKFQALRHKMASAYTEMEICKQFNYFTALRLGKGEYVVKEATMAKLKSTKMADEVIYDCLQMLGGYGYIEEYPMARLLRDSRLGPIGGGTSEILKEIIAKIVIDKKDYKPAT
jgi:alkylation response protein AidB-like acyl-CoA dehydrogenase